MTGGAPVEDGSPPVGRIMQLGASVPFVATPAQGASDQPASERAATGDTL